MAEVDGSIGDLYSGLRGGGYAGNCGDGLIDGNESSDGTALGRDTCEGPGFASGALGWAADGVDGPNEKDLTLLFVYYGDTSEYGFISQRIRELVAGSEPETVIDQEPLRGTNTVNS